ncbi:hypothetical protein TRICI_004200 [Trichomonascus ciferrii]|uniref:choline-phosphate cytidylyltransferase n=1 Tax=Trichomonascus ciferrii TaxID=44093 RepID=A0A642V0Z8_9ASCO|nr:hypothetical protein TRICI_004200 [Trichomonascus ciferrii]
MSSSGASTPQKGGLKKTSSISSLFSMVTGRDSEERQQPQSSGRRASLFSLVRGSKRKKRHSDDEEEDEESEEQHSSEEEEESSSEQSSSEEERTKKRRKQRQLTKEEEERLEAEQKREQELDELLEPQYRRFRPRGYKFNPPPEDRPVRVYADGVFDLFHLGHMKQLEQAKTALPNATLICGIPSDRETHKHKGLTVLSDKQRAETLRHCRWVDEVIEDAPWSLTEEFLKRHKIDYVAHDDLPYASAGDDDIYRPLKEKGMFLTTQRTEGVSTSDIITKIIRDYDKYLMRNFARGASRKDLNVSWLKKNELDLKRHVSGFRSNFESVSKDVYHELMGTLSTALQKRKSKSPVTDFAANYSGGSFFGNVKGWMSRNKNHPDTASNSPTPAADLGSPDDSAKEDK